MTEDFNIKKGLANVLKKVVGQPEFAGKVLDLVLGRKDAAGELKSMLRGESYSQSLNEVVAIHRTLKAGLNESLEPNNGKDKGMLRKVAEIPKKSARFQSEVIARALKKPGAAMALLKLISTNGTDPKAWAVLTPALIEAATEVAYGDEPIQAELSEGIETNENSVNIMVGRFQPFTLGHLKCLKSIKDSLGVPTLLCVIPGNGDDKHPFMGDVQDEMYEKLKSANPDLIADVCYVKNAFLEAWVIAANDRGLEPVSWTCGTDRFAAYDSMAQKHGQKYGLSPEFKVYCLDRADDNISATNVRECLVNGDKEGFMRQMPECLWDMYDEMRQVMVGDTMPVQTITESKAYSDFKKMLNAGLKDLLK